MPLPAPILDKLLEAKSNGQLVTYHKWGDDPTIFLVGFVNEIKSDRILFDKVGTNGEPENEIDIVAMDAIQWLDFDNDYLRGLEKLYPVYETLIGRRPRAGIKASRKQAVEQNLRLVQGTGEVVLLEVGGDRRDCLIHSVYDKFVSYTVLRDGGRPDGICWMKIELIDVLRRRTDRQIADQFLFEHK